MGKGLIGQLTCMKIVKNEVIQSGEREKGKKKTESTLAHRLTLPKDINGTEFWVQSLSYSVHANGDDA